VSPDESPSETATAPPSSALTASDVKTYATLAHAGTVVGALVLLPFMWVPAVGLFLYFRTRDHAGLLRRHLAEAASLALVLAGYAMLARFALWAADADDLYLDLLPVVVALVASYPTLLAVKAVLRFESYRHPKALAWIPLD
jgi:hypothetical protein